jgi:hypothetical protein
VHNTHVICRHCDINGGRYTRHQPSEENGHSSEQYEFLSTDGIYRYPASTPITARNFIDKWACLIAAANTELGAPESLTLHGDRQ